MAGQSLIEETLTQLGKNLSEKGRKFGQKNALFVA
jgi:hypothetical protein